MKFRFPLFYGPLVLLALTLFSCHDDDKPTNGILDNNHVLVVRRLKDADYYSSELSSVDLSSGTVTKLIDFVGSQYLSVRSGDDLFFLGLESADAVVLNKFNLSTRTMTSVVKNGMRGVFGAAMAFHNDKLYVPGYDFGGSEESYVYRLDPTTFVVEDTLRMNSTEQIQDLVFVGGQLFVKQESQVKVFAAGSQVATTSIALDPFNYGGLLVDKNDNVLVPWGGAVQSINSHDFSITTLKPAANDPSNRDTFFPFTIRPAFAKNENVMYVLNAGQNSYTSLGKIDFAAGKVSSLDGDFLFLPGYIGSIAYSQSGKQLIVAGAEYGQEPRLQVVSLEGKLLKEIPMNGYILNVVVE